MTYQKLIQENPLVLVEFYATWCPHCRKMMPIVEQVKELLEGTAEVVQLDIDQNQEAADFYGAESVPTFILYKNGEEKWRHSGEIDGNALFATVQSYS